MHFVNIIQGIVFGLIPFCMNAILDVVYAKGGLGKLKETGHILSLKNEKDGNPNTIRNLVFSVGYAIIWLAKRNDIALVGTIIALINTIIDDLFFYPKLKDRIFIYEFGIRYRRRIVLEDKFEVYDENEEKISTIAFLENEINFEIVSDDVQEKKANSAIIGYKNRYSVNIDEKWFKRKT
jgi:hypothetical protein